MARVSQEHLDARRRQILDGAARCFARNGFHATSMQDVLAEAGLSAGAVYRYFRSKDELIAAIADETFVRIRGAFAEASEVSPPLLPDVLIARVLTIVLDGGIAGAERQAFARLIIQVWAETLRDETLAKTLAQGFGGMRDIWSGLVDAYRDAGLVPADVSSAAMARTLIATVQGFIAQQALFGDVEIGVLEEGLRGIMSMNAAAAAPPAR
ncbi:TetR/AcrR family transcriptional regulator [Streptomyces roseofulvus]|uniref:TetR/AcrR family transcriptional regulator n=2 Tax=Streptomyces TaxID=1883 RepID=A0ABU4K0K7_9ACTN|nr:TetR/AcrR family transcriptional regulator [Streptomyces roseolus]MDX2291294.1 TetR/AcrR family transcriptional regulator [Streptomyces roseolus]